MQENLPPGWTYEIMGTDISTEMVKRAETAEYSQVEVNRGLPASQLVQYFERAGAHWRITPALRRNVSFRLMNLTAPLPAMQPFDVIFLRNVLIYFDVAVKRTVLQNVARLLRPDGWLFLGAAETTIGHRRQLRAGGRRPYVRLPGPKRGARGPREKGMRPRCAPW